MTRRSDSLESILTESRSVVKIPMDASPIPFSGYESMPSYTTTPDMSPCSPFLVPAFMPVFSFSSYVAPYLLQPPMMGPQRLAPPQPCYRPVSPVSPGKLQLPSYTATDPPVYVNPKQYHRILKRRMARGSLTPHVREKGKTYKHESRHQHACRRRRGPKGKFLSKDECAKLEQSLNLSELGQALEETAKISNDDPQHCP